MKVTAASAAASDDDDMDEDEKRWRAESDLSTLIEAEKIKRDAKRLKAAMAMRRERIAELKKLEG